MDGETDVTVAVAAREGYPNWKLVHGAPVVLSVLVLVFLTAFVLSSLIKALLALVAAGVVTAIAYVWLGPKTGADEHRWHRLLEGRPLAFTVLVLFAILAGGIAELVPSIMKPRPDALASSTATIAGGARQEPYSPLELAGRDLYVREGCYNCHSQMVRPFRHEVLRYGAYSRLEESIYDHPFQFGSKRTGPDLHRVGGKYPNLWHYEHLLDPRSTSPGSNMPSYAFMKTSHLDYAAIPGKLRAMWRLGVPYSDQDLTSGVEAARRQAQGIRDDLAKNSVEIDPESEILALIAYLQRLGRGPQVTSMAQQSPER